MGKISPRLATVFCMSLRFIPLLKRKWAQIKEAQSAMGYFRADSITERLASYARVFSALVSWALENAVDTAASMSARGYGLPGKRSFSLFRFTRADGALLMVTALLCAGTLFGFLSGSADFAFYPVITPIGADASALICYVSFGILAFLPFIFEVKEALKWRYLRSKL
jgi:energy-coupling factor transport system permease protein